MINVTMKRERETKGTWRFKEESGAPLIGVLYLKKLAVKTSFGGEVPAVINVQIDVAK